MRPRCSTVSYRVCRDQDRAGRGAHGCCADGRVCDRDRSVSIESVSRLRRHEVALARCCSIPARLKGRSHGRRPDFSVVSLKYPRRDFPLADASRVARAAGPPSLHNPAQPRRHCLSRDSHDFGATTRFRPYSMYYQRYGKAHRKCIWSDEIGLIRCNHCISAVNHARAASSPRDKRAIDDDSDEVRGFPYQLVGMTEWLQI